MIDIDKVLDVAKEKDASDVHLICGLKPMLRIRRDLIEYDCPSPLTEDDMYDIYDYFVRGNVDKDKVFKDTKKLDTSFEFEDIRLRVNISLSNEIPILTLRLIKNELPKYEELGVPDIVRRMTYQPQGLILVTGKTNSGKTTTLNALINEINETQNRMELVINKIIKNNYNKNVVVFTHKRAILCYLTKYLNSGYNLDDRLILTFNDNVIIDDLENDVDIIKLDIIKGKIKNVVTL